MKIGWAALAAERFRAAIEQHSFALPSSTHHEISMTISRDVACTANGVPHNPRETLLQHVDDALYQSKARGRICTNLGAPHQAVIQHEGLQQFLANCSTLYEKTRNRHAQNTLLGRLDTVDG